MLQQLASAESSEEEQQSSSIPQGQSLWSTTYIRIADTELLDEQLDNIGTLV